mgnify:FL=1
MKARTILVPAVTTSSATYYTVPANTRAKLVMFHAANTASSGATVANASVKVGSAVTPIFKTLSIAFSSVFNAGFSDTSYIMLEAGSLIVAHSNNVSTSLIFTVEEVPFIVSTN